jgi:Histidine kinase-, DNA gyrase B-, and HSP90-like ATPase
MSQRQTSEAMDFEKSGPASASSPAPQNLQFERQDWSLFRTVEGLQQRAGVPKSRLRRLVLKELADNGLDENANVRVGTTRDGYYYVEDDGPGIDPEKVAELFSISRPMQSSKLLRLPTRGALGNGLRVVAGAVLASEGTLVVTTRNRRMTLRPQRDGTTTIVSIEVVSFPKGTRVDIALGPALPQDPRALYWAQTACLMSESGETYSGGSSAWWYDATQFHELLTACGSTPVRELISHLDGCTGAKAGRITVEAGLGRTLCKDVTAAQARQLLTVARMYSKRVKPERLGFVGSIFGPAYARASGTAKFGSTEPFAEVPFVVEAWSAEIAGEKTTLLAHVNRTPITAAVNAARDKREINFFGCGLSDTVAEAPKDKHFTIRLNIVTPYMPITSDGKAPNLEPFLDQIETAVSKAVTKSRRPNATGTKSQKGVVLDRLDEVIASVSGDGAYRFNERQLLYALRPIVQAEMGEELKLANFKTIITDYENEHGDIPGMYREPRGTIYHPHTGQTLSLGTLMVEEYERPSWLYNKLLYIEKEGFAEALKAVRWAERHDCSPMSSKGFTTRAVKDLVDKLAEHDEPVTVFCVHDADAAGTMIHQTFQEETRARGARKVEIVNLGLEPWEALAMGLEVETFEVGERRRPVADYVRERDDRDWDDWLQTHRVELNAMTTPAFIAWLDGKMAGHAGKLIPPGDVLIKEFDARIETMIRAEITERILREARLEDKVAASVAAVERPTADALADIIQQRFEDSPESTWRDHIDEAVKDAVHEGDDTS